MRARCCVKVDRAAQIDVRSYRVAQTSSRSSVFASRRPHQQPIGPAVEARAESRCCPLQLIERGQQAAARLDTALQVES
jgi:hypothetical protein